MNCINCGIQLADGTRFCSNCGAPQPDPAQTQPLYQQPVQQAQAQYQQSQPQYQQPQAQYQQPDFQQPYLPDSTYAPQPPKKSKKPLIITLIIVGVIAVLSIAAAIAAPLILDKKPTIEKAEEYLDDSNYSSAIAEYEAVIENDPKNTDAYIGLAELYAEMAEEGEEDAEDMIEEIEDLIKDADDEDVEEELTDIIDKLAKDTEKDSDETTSSATSGTTSRYDDYETSDSTSVASKKLKLSDIKGTWGATGYYENGSEIKDPMNLTIYDNYISIETLTDTITIYEYDMEFDEDSFIFYYNGFNFTYTYNGSYIEGVRDGYSPAYMYHYPGAVELAEPEGEVLNIWCWNDEFQRRVVDYYPGYIDNGDGTGRIGDVTVKWTINPNADNGYQIPLDAALRDQYNVAANEKIDIFLIEADYADKYVNSDYTLPLYELGITDADTAEMYEYTKQIVTDYNGNLKAATWQACPGVFAYKRSIANAVLGTDDPDEVQRYVSNWDEFDKTAQKMKDNGYFMLSGYDDAYRTFSNNVSAPWVNDNNQIIIDDNILRWVEQTKTYTDNGYNNKNGLWSEGWAIDQSSWGKVFGFFYSTWGINFTLPGNACMDRNWDYDPSSYGDWAICYGPESYYWGGTWICASYLTDNKTLVKDIIYQLCCNDEIMYEIATDPYARDYTNNMAAMERAANSSYHDDFLGGQNSFMIFHEAAMRVDMSNVSPYDQGLNESFQAAFYYYFNGRVDFDTALEDFYESAITKYPALWYSY